VCELGIHHIDFFDKILFLRVKLADPLWATNTNSGYHLEAKKITTYREVGNGFIAPIATHKPPWRLTNIPDTKEEHAGGHELNGKWYKPLSVTGRQSLAYAIVDPGYEET
jgi:hypothetical protein